MCWSTIWITPDEEKHRQGLFLIKHNFITKQTELSYPLSFYIINCKYINHTQIITQKLNNNRTCSESLDDNSNGRPFLPTNYWRALKHRLLRTPELALVSLAGTRRSNNQVPVFKLNTNSELISKFSQLASCIKPSYCRLSLKTPSLQFSLFPQ